MKLLTSKAIQGYRDYTKRTIAYAKYKVGSTYHKTKIESVDVTEEGIVEVRFKIEAGILKNGFCCRGLLLCLPVGNQ